MSLRSTSIVRNLLTDSLPRSEP